MNLKIGRLEHGKLNSIGDVPGVRVGHCTIDNDRHKTGVTVVLPCEDDIFKRKMVAARQNGRFDADHRAWHAGDPHRADQHP